MAMEQAYVLTWDVPTAPSIFGQKPSQSLFMRLPLAILRAIFSLAVTITVLFAANPATANVTNKVLATAPVNLGFGRVAGDPTKTDLVTMTNFGSPGLTVSQMRGTSNRPIYIASNAFNELLSIPLTDSEDDAAELTVMPAAINFSNVSPGSYATQNGTLSATNSAVTISSITSSDPEFTVSGLSLPITIPAGQYASFTVTFTPQSSGSVYASLTFASDASNSLASEPVSGSSTPHSVDLSWNAGISQDVIGYNVYRGNVSGGPYTKINPTLDPDLNYTDTFVFSGNTYYYVATAVNSNNEESTYSNEAQAVIP